MSCLKTREGVVLIGAGVQGDLAVRELAAEHVERVGAHPIAVWHRFDDTSRRVQARTISPAGALGPVRTLSAAGQTARDPQGRHRRRR